jgi:hypothetical protein
MPNDAAKDLQPDEQKPLEDDELESVAGGANNPVLSTTNPTGANLTGTNPTGLSKYE